MKKITTTLMACVLANFLFSNSALAETERVKPNKFMAERAEPFYHPTFRLFANYDYVMTNPSALNDYRATTLWNSTTVAQGTFGGMNGFSVGGSYLLGPGYLGVEYAFASQELSNTTIAASTTSVHDTFDYQTVYGVYDLAYDINETSSYEFGGGIGYALNYQFHNIFTNGGTTEDVLWSSNPIVFKVRGYYNYHFSENIRARVGASYEYATSDNLTSDSAHPTVGTGIISGQAFGHVVNMSGVRLSAGIVITL